MTNYYADGNCQRYSQYQIVSDINTFNFIVDNCSIDCLIEKNLFPHLKDLTMIDRLFQRYKRDKKEDILIEHNTMVVLDYFTSVEFARYWLDQFPRLPEIILQQSTRAMLNLNIHKIINTPEYLKLVIEKPIDPKVFDKETARVGSFDPECIKLLYMHGFNVSSRRYLSDQLVIAKMKKDRLLINYECSKYVEVMMDEEKIKEQQYRESCEWIDKDNYDGLNKANINNFDKYGKSALIYAIEQRKLNRVRQLLAHGADPNCVCKTRFVIDYKYNCGIGEVNAKVALIGCITYEGTRCITENIYKSNETTLRIGYNQIQINKLSEDDPNLPFPQIKHRYMVYPIMYAIENGDIQVIELLIDHGADLLVIDDEGFDIMGYIYKLNGIVQKDIRDLVKPLFDEARRTKHKTPKVKIMEKVNEALGRLGDVEIQESVINEAVQQLALTLAESLKPK